MSERMVLFVVHDGAKDAIVVSKVIHEILAKICSFIRALVS